MKYILTFLILLGTSFAAENEAEMNIDGKTLICSQGKVIGEQVQKILQSNNENQESSSIENITIGADVTEIQQGAFQCGSNLTVSIEGRADFKQLMQLILRAAQHKNVTKIIVTSSNLVKKENSQNNDNAQDNDQEIQKEGEPTSSNNSLTELIVEMGNDIQDYTYYCWNAAYNSNKSKITFTRGESMIEEEEEDVGNETNNNDNKDNEEKNEDNNDENRENS